MTKFLFSPGASDWEDIGPMAEIRKAAGCGFVSSGGKDYIIVVGGEGYETTMDQLDLETMQWVG